LLCPTPVPILSYEEGHITQAVTNQYGNLRVTSLLFADDVLPLTSSSHDLQRALELFVECDNAWMRVSSSKFEAMLLIWKKVE